MATDGTDRVSSRPWPFRGRPQPDELLSSWFLRAAAAMGLKPYALGHVAWRSRPPPLTRDIDGMSDERVLAVMANGTATPMELCRQTVLSSYEGYLFETHQPLGRTSWIMPLGIRARRRHHPGLQFCPACLVDEPYFRRRWRIAWSTVCVRHQLQLLDRCSACSAVLSPFRSPRAFACYRCGMLLADSEHRPASRRMVVFQGAQEDILDQGWASLSATHFPYSVQYFQMLRHLGRIVSSGPRSGRMRAIIAERWGGNPDEFVFAGIRDIERLNVSDRQRLFDLVSRILEAWPERFVEAARAAHLWRSWAIKDDPHPPFSFYDLVIQQLSVPAYRPSLEEVQSAAAYLRRRWLGYDRTALKKLVGDSIHVKTVFEEERRRRRRALVRAARRTLRR